MNKPTDAQMREIIAAAAALYKDARVNAPYLERVWRARYPVEHRIATRLRKALRATPAGRAALQGLLVPAPDGRG